MNKEAKQAEELQQKKDEVIYEQEPELGSEELPSHKQALLELQRQKDEEKKKKKMVDLKLNYLVSDLKERLGFITKKHKIDHIMN